MQRTGNTGKCSQRRKKDQQLSSGNTESIQRQDKRNSCVYNDNFTREEKNTSSYRHRVLYLYMRKIN